jgi:hypothetical protein
MAHASLVFYSTARRPVFVAQPGSVNPTGAALPTAIPEPDDFLISSGQPVE